MREELLKKEMDALAADKEEVLILKHQSKELEIKRETYAKTITKEKTRVTDIKKNIKQLDKQIKEFLNKGLAHEAQEMNNQITLLTKELEEGKEIFADTKIEELPHQLFELKNAIANKQNEIQKKESFIQLCEEMFKHEPNEIARYHEFEDALQQITQVCIKKDITVKIRYDIKKNTFSIQSLVFEKNQSSVLVENNEFEIQIITQGNESTFILDFLLGDDENLVIEKVVIHSIKSIDHGYGYDNDEPDRYDTTRLVGFRIPFGKGISAYIGKTPKPTYAKLDNVQTPSQSNLFQFKIIENPFLK